MSNFILDKIKERKTVKRNAEILKLEDKIGYMKPKRDNWNPEEEAQYNKLYDRYAKLVAQKQYEDNQMAQTQINNVDKSKRIIKQTDFNTNLNVQGQQTFSGNTTVKSNKAVKPVKKNNSAKSKK